MGFIGGICCFFCFVFGDPSLPVAAFTSLFFFFSFVIFCLLVTLRGKSVAKRNVGSWAGSTELLTGLFLFYVLSFYEMLSRS